MYGWWFDCFCLFVGFSNADFIALFDFFKLIFYFDIYIMQLPGNMSCFFLHLEK